MTGFNLSAWALEHRCLLLFFIVLGALAGAVAYIELGRSEDPPFTFRIMTIVTEWPGATSREVEQFVTDRLEKKLEELPYYDYVESYSRPGESVIFLNLSDYMPPSAAPDQWYQARKKLADIATTLPAGVHGPFFNDEFGDVYSLIYAFTGPDFSPAQMKRIVEEVREELLRVDGVEKADLIGTQDQRIWVDVSSRRLSSLGLSPQALTETIDNEIAVTDSGTVNGPNDRVSVRLASDPDTVARLKSLPISIQGHLVTLADVAEIHRGYADPRVYTMRYRGREAIGLGVVMKKGGNVLDLGKALETTMAGIEATLPAGVQVDIVADQSRVVSHAIGDFQESLLEALAIVMAVSFLSLGWRTGIVVALTVPLVLGITFAIMLAARIDMHRISAGALIIALGLLVDDAIIAVEMMLLKIEEGWDRLRAGSFAFDSTALPMLAGTMVTIEGFIPVGFAQSSTAEFCSALFWVLAVSLAVSWLAAVLFTPCLGYYLLPSRPHGSVGAGSEPAPDTRFSRRLRRMVEAAVRARYTTLAVTAGLFVLALAGFGLLRQQFFPSSVRPELVVDLELAEGASYEASAHEVDRMEAILARAPGIEHWSSYVGGGAPHFYLSLIPELPRPNIAQIVVLTRGLAERDALRALIDSRAVEFPDVRLRLSPLEDGPPVGYPVQFRVMGADPNVIRGIASRIREIMQADRRLRDVNLSWGDLAKRVTFEPDPAKLAALGVSRKTVAEAIGMLLDGVPATQVREGTELIDVVVRGSPAERANPATLGELQLPIPGGATVSVDELAHERNELEEPILWRRDRLTELTVQADIVEGAQALDESHAIDRQLSGIRAGLPAGYRIELGGAIEGSSKGQAAIQRMVPLMALVMITTLMLQLQSLSRVVMVVLTAPLGLIGVTAALLVTGRPFGFVGLLGVIALLGIIMRNSVILVDQIDQDIRAGHPAEAAIVDATIRRARPILLTAATAILAMFPLAGTSFWGSMAVAIMGGLAVATALTLFFLPALYAAWFRIALFQQERPTRRAAAGV